MAIPSIRDSPPEVVIVDKVDNRDAEIAEAIYDSFRSYRRDRCAIFTESDSISSFLQNSKLDADFLHPDENFRWTGVQTSLRRKWKRIIIGDYLDWFSWYMKWQRFNAFHVIVLIRPISHMSNSEYRGYIDGFLTRLMSKRKPHKIIIVEEKEFEPLLKKWLTKDDSTAGTPQLRAEFGRRELQQAILATLYGTLISQKSLSASVEKTLSARLLPDWKSIYARMHHGSLVEVKHRWFRSLTEDGMKLVQCVGDIPGGPSEMTQEGDQLFQLSRRRRYVKLNEKWVEEHILILADSRGWFTIPVLYNHLRDLVQDGFSHSLSPPDFLDVRDEADSRTAPSLPLPSNALLRRLSEKLVSDGKLDKTTWFRETGRPSTIFYLPGQRPLRENDRCGQCALYISLRRRCRLWWLLDKSFGTGDPRWSKEGAHPLTLFELHKMRNSWRIGPHSSACLRFLDKKRDYRRKTIPEYCDICYETLPTVKASESSRRCDNCGTRYFTLRNGVRVLTSYEHEFRRNYKEIAGRDPGPDLEQQKEEYSASTFSILERAEYESHRTDPGTPDNPYTRTLVVFPTDRMLVKEGKLFVLGRRKVEALPLTGTLIVDHLAIEPEQRVILEKAGALIKDVPKSENIPVKDMTPRYDFGPTIEKLVRENPGFVRGFALAMAKSALNATRRIASLVKLTGSEVARLESEQLSFLRRLERAERPNFLVYEALIMKGYWKCYDLALKGALTRFGPRKKSRFVRDYVTNPAGRARGYSAVDAAINYLHQRRLLKCRLINAKLGLGWNSGEGFLHRKSRRAEGLGLLLDLTDPFKFADREKLLETILSHDLNWRDFYIATDRQGVKFYYPRPQAIDILELIGTDADNITLRCEGKSMPLLEGYEYTASKLIQSLQTFSPQSYLQFVYGEKSVNE